MLYAAKFVGSGGGIEASPSRFGSGFGAGAGTGVGGAGAVIAVMSAAVAAAGFVFDAASIVLSVATPGFATVVSTAFWIGCGSSFVTRPVCLSDAKKIRFPSGLNQASVSFHFPVVSWYRSAGFATFSLNSFA